MNVCQISKSPGRKQKMRRSVKTACTIIGQLLGELHRSHRMSLCQYCPTPVKSLPISADIYGCLRVAPHNGWQEADTSTEDVIRGQDCQPAQSLVMFGRHHMTSVSSR